MKNRPVTPRINKISTTLLLFSLFSFGAFSNLNAQEDRVWTDSTGHYTIEGKLLAFNDQRIVLERKDGDLVSLAVSDLSKEDKKHVESQANQPARGAKTLTLQSGLKVQGTIVEFGERELNLKRGQRGVYVNDRIFNNLPAVYKSMVPKIVSHFEKTTIEDGAALEKWIAKQPRRRASYTCEGVMLELANGDQYGIPFFFFSDADRKVLESGWERWEAAKEDQARQDEESLYLRAQSQARDSDIEELKQVAKMNFMLQTYNAGFHDLWEVALMAPNGATTTVVVPARDSREAGQVAMAKYPNTRLGPIAKVRPNNRNRFRRR